MGSFDTSNLFHCIESSESVSSQSLEHLCGSLDIWQPLFTHGKKNGGFGHVYEHVCACTFSIYGAFDFRLRSLKAKAEHRSWHQCFDVVARHCLNNFLVNFQLPGVPMAFLLSHKIFDTVLGCKLHKYTQNKYMKHLMSILFLFLIVDTNFDSKDTYTNSIMSFGVTIFLNFDMESFC